MNINTPGKFPHSEALPLPHIPKGSRQMNSCLGLLLFPTRFKVPHQICLPFSRHCHPISTCLSAGAISLPVFMVVSAFTVHFWMSELTYCKLKLVRKCKASLPFLLSPAPQSGSDPCPGCEIDWRDRLPLNFQLTHSLNKEELFCL